MKARRIGPIVVAMSPGVNRLRNVEYVLRTRFTT
jgi:hypothetical protein